jgi:dTDP-4-dehydrorhamnose reductase
MSRQNLDGLYHVASPHALSKFDFGVALARQFGFNENLIRAVSWRDAGLRAVRSPNLTLSVEKLHTALGHPLPLQAQGMMRFYAEYQSGYCDSLRALAAAPEG